MTGLINEQVIIGALAGAVVSLATVMWKSVGKNQRRDDKRNEQVLSALIKNSQTTGAVTHGLQRLIDKVNHMHNQIENHMNLQDNDVKTLLEINFSISEELEIIQKKLQTNVCDEGKKENG